MGASDDDLDAPDESGLGLLPPPRKVPPLLKLSCIFGGVLPQLGWIFFGMGLAFVWVSGGMADTTPIHFALRGKETTTGQITNVESTSTSVNGQQIYAYHFVFVTPVSGQHQGVAYAPGGRAEREGTVTVEYVPGRPHIARIEGMAGGAMPLWALPMVVIFPLIGLIFILVSLPAGRRGARLLEVGRLVHGKLIDSTRTNTRVNHRPVMKMTFEFADESGQRHQAVAKTHEPERLEDQPREPLLYDPMRPSQAVLLDNLPGRPVIDLTGSFSPDRAGRAVAALIAPCLTILGHGTYLLVRFIL